MNSVNDLEADADALHEASDWRADIFMAMVDLLGEAKADEILARFQVELARRFQAPENRESVRHDAHTIASTSSLLGFTKLSDLAVALEARCNDGEAFAGSFAALQVSAARVNAAIERRLSHRPAPTAKVG